MNTHTLTTGLGYGESPRWHDGRLWLCNWGTGEVLAVDPAGNTQVMATLPATTIPFSIDWLPDGRLLVISGPDARLLVQRPDGGLDTYADLKHLAAGFNELVVDGHGNAYVNGGDYNPMHDAEFTPGIVALVTPDGDAREVARGVHFGNGMAVTPDNKTLIVADSYQRRLTAFDIHADGTLSTGHIWADLGTGVPDGICIDTEGAVWHADVPNKRCVRVRKGGEVLSTVEADRGCFACMLGGPDGTTLYMTAAQWHGMDNVTAEHTSGVVLTTTAPAPAAGWPATR
jgi:sugar lactone lactonase YvrE